MPDDQWERVQDVFLAAADLPREERSRFLDEACREDPSLRAEVESLLQSDDKGSRIETAVRREAHSLLTDAPADGGRLGVYRLVREIGRGGMGVVYLAERADEFQKQVAIKLVKRGMDTDQILARFRHERQILARFEHPYIARVLDGGATPDGRPYIVMEYVKGLPISDYCASRHLSVADRIALLRKVCAAVQYAHQNLVVHRDLKPGNILVDDTGAPRLLDFGIAKLLGDSDGLTLATLHSGGMLTPQYASPEQLLGEPVTTASDVYSLGVILYELLARAPAHPSTTSRLKALHERDQEDVVSPGIAARRTSAAGHGAARIGPDLDNIVMMAMRRDPRGRYASVEHFSEDLRRYLDDLPVMARPQTVRYRTSKFLRRHMVSALAAAVLGAATIAGIGLTLYESRISQRRFDELRHLANTFLSDVNDRIQVLPGSTLAEESLVKTSLEYLDRLARESHGDSALQMDLAGAYLKIGDVQGYSVRPSLGRPTEAMQSYNKGLSIARRLASRNHDPKVLRLLARLLHRTGYILRNPNPTESKARFHEALTLVEPLYADDPRNPENVELMMDLHSQLSAVEGMAGNQAGAVAGARKVLEVADRSARDNPSDVSNVVLTRAHIRMTRALQMSGDLSFALDHARTAVGLAEQLSAGQPRNLPWRRDLMNAYERLAQVNWHAELLSMGDAVTAASYERKVVAIAEELSGIDPNNYTAWSDLAIAYRDMCAMERQQDPRKAVDDCRKALAIEARWSGAEGFAYIRSLVVSAEAAFQNGSATAALEILGEAGAKLEKLMTHSPANTDQRWLQLRAGNLEGALRLSKGAPGEALAAYRRTADLAESLLQSAPADLVIRKSLADAYEGMGRAQEALGARPPCEPYRKSLDIWNGWGSWGTPSIYDLRRKTQASEALARCEGSHR